MPRKAPRSPANTRSRPTAGTGTGKSTQRIPGPNWAHQYFEGESGPGFWFVPGLHLVDPVAYDTPDDDGRWPWHVLIQGEDWISGRARTVADAKRRALRSARGLLEADMEMLGE